MNPSTQQFDRLLRLVGLMPTDMRLVDSDCLALISFFCSKLTSFPGSAWERAASEALPLYWFVSQARCAGGACKACVPRQSLGTRRGAWERGNSVIKIFRFGDRVCVYVKDHRGIYARRTIGGDRDYRHSSWIAVTGSPGGARSGSTHVLAKPQKYLAGFTQLPRHKSPVSLRSSLHRAFRWRSIERARWNRLGLFAAILPFLEQANQQNRINFSYPQAS